MVKEEEGSNETLKSEMRIIIISYLTFGSFRGMETKRVDHFL